MTDEIHRITGSGTDGPTLEILQTGAAVRALHVPDRDGNVRNVVLGHQDPADYRQGTDYFGATVGRFANRLAGGRFTIGDQTYVVPANDGANAVHGGPDGFHRRTWGVAEVSGSAVTLELVSPAGDQGFPGELRVTVRYAVEGHEVRIDYTAVTDAPTVVNLTNHSHVNLDGEGAESVDSHRLQVDADRYTAVGPDLIPTGELALVDGSAFDLRDSARVGPRLRSTDPQVLLARGIDHNFVVRGEGLRRHAALHAPDSGIRLEVLSDQPGLQVYTGNFFDGSAIGTGGGAYRQGAGIALETQNFPDAPNQPGFPSAALEPGQVYRTTTIWRFDLVR